MVGMAGTKANRSWCSRCQVVFHLLSWVCVQGSYFKLSRLIFLITRRWEERRWFFGWLESTCMKLSWSQSLQNLLPRSSVNPAPGPVTKQGFKFQVQDKSDFACFKPHDIWKTFTNNCDSSTRNHLAACLFRHLQELSQDSGSQDVSRASISVACSHVCWGWAALALGTVDRRASQAALQSQVLPPNSCELSGQR